MASFERRILHHRLLEPRAEDLLRPIHEMFRSHAITSASKANTPEVTPKLAVATIPNFSGLMKAAGTTSAT